MIRSPFALPGPAQSIALLGVIAALVVLPDGASRLALGLLSLLGIFVTVWLTRTRASGQSAGFLENALLLGIGARLLVYAGIVGTVGPLVFAPDAASYQAMGMELLAFFSGDISTLPTFTGNLQVGYPALNAVMFAVFGETATGPVVANIFISTWTALPVFYMVRRFLPDRPAIARWAALVVLLFPSLVLWSVLNIRDAAATFLVAMTAYYFVRLQQSPKLQDALGVVMLLALMATLREYLTVLIGMSGTAGIIIGHSRSPVKSLVWGALILGGLIFALQSLGLGGTLTSEPSLQQVDYLRRDLARGAGSAYGAEYDVGTVEGVVSFLPVGLAYFLFAPFPWDISSSLQAVTLPETLIWYSLVPFAIWGLWLALRHDARTYTVPLSILMLVTLAYALVEGNVGTAYRHRAQILPLVFIFTALGLRDVWAIWQQRRAGRARRRHRVSRELEWIRPRSSPRRRGS